MTDRMVSPAELADALGLPPPTAEQERVIAAPAGPTLVVAGAGAGKTETMASRVVWMVANRRVAPDEVLGLTFTRKAAQQLTSRIRERLLRLAGSAAAARTRPERWLARTDLGLRPGNRHLPLLCRTAAGRTRAAAADRTGRDAAVADPVLAVGATAWSPAGTATSTPNAPPRPSPRPSSRWPANWPSIWSNPTTCARHTPNSTNSSHTLPAGPRQRGGPAKELPDILDAQQQRVDLLPLVEQTRRDLRRGGALDFGAQMSLAARRRRGASRGGSARSGSASGWFCSTNTRTPGTRSGCCCRRCSAAAVDGRLAVTAVGDPMQSIYGWRGASAANLPRFATDFPLAPGEPAPVLPLLTSWRNPPEALALANTVADPLRERQPSTVATAAAAAAGRSG